MVGGEIEPNANFGMEITDRFELEGAHLDRERIETSEFFLRGAVEHRHFGPLFGEQKRGRLAAAAGAEHRDIFFVVVGDHRSLSVARPRRAKTMERIQNRTITVLSFQPFSSK